MKVAFYFSLSRSSVGRFARRMIRLAAFDCLEFFGLFVGSCAVMNFSESLSYFLIDCQ